MRRLGGVILGAGMILDIAHGDYMYGHGPVKMILRQVIDVRHEWDQDWVIVDGQEKIDNGPWRYRRIQVKVKALSRSLTTATV